MRSAVHNLRLLTAVLPLVLLSAAGRSSTSTTDETLAANHPRPATADKYPDFSQPLDSAMPQMTDEEAAAFDEARPQPVHQRRTGAISDAEYRRRVAELRQLGAETE